MRRTNLTELARNPNFISGIYNYCDRWCERCPFTSRCLVYAQESEENDGSSSTEQSNETFWRSLSSILQQTRELIAQWKPAANSEDDTAIEETIAVSRRHAERSSQSKLAKLGREYARAVTQWFTEFDQTISSSDVDTSESDVDQLEQLEDAREVIHWYQYQIAVKTMRALSSATEEQEGTHGYSKDSDGSAKVALIGIDRSIGAWRVVQVCLPERADLIVPLILRLEQLRQLTERKFPRARDFIRPGFDEILGEAN